MSQNIFWYLGYQDTPLFPRLCPGVQVSWYPGGPVSLCPSHLEAEKRTKLTTEGWDGRCVISVASALEVQPEEVPT